MSHTKIPEAYIHSGFVGPITAADMSKHLASALPSRFQIGERVVVRGGGRHSIHSVTFTESKVIYTFSDGTFAHSEDVYPLPNLKLIGVKP